MKKSLLFLLFCLTAWLGAKAQNTATVQPKIMVIPYTQEGEDLRTVLEDDANKRIVLTKIKEAFDSRGFSTVDFTAKVRAVSQNAAFTSGNQSDIKSMVIESSGRTSTWRRKSSCTSPPRETPYASSSPATTPRRVRPCPTR